MCAGAVAAAAILRCVSVSDQKRMIYDVESDSSGGSGLVRLLGDYLITPVVCVCSLCSVWLIRRSGKHCQSDTYHCQTQRNLELVTLFAISVLPCQRSRMPIFTFTCCDVSVQHKAQPDRGQWRRIQLNIFRFSNEIRDDFLCTQTIAIFGHLQPPD